MRFQYRCMQHMHRPIDGDEEAEIEDRRRVGQQEGQHEDGGAIPAHGRKIAYHRERSWRCWSWIGPLIDHYAQQAKDTLISPHAQLVQSSWQPFPFDRHFTRAGQWFVPK